jgi:hypothetical protein
MAEIARACHNGSVLQILCQTICLFGNSKYRAKQKSFLFSFFFLAWTITYCIIRETKGKENGKSRVDRREG